MQDSGHPLRLTELTPGELRSLVAMRPWLILPVGALDAVAPHLPLGLATRLVEQIADDLSARFRVPCAPVLQFGVARPIEDELTGSAGLQRKTLHRVMNELIASWESSAGIRDFVVLSALDFEGQREALGTIRTLRARLQVVDLTGLDHREAGDEAPATTGERLLTDLAPRLLRGVANLPPIDPAAADRAQRTYTFLLERVASRCFPFRTP
jgi:creatinine amidohydrolase